MMFRYLFLLPPVITEFDLSFTIVNYRFYSNYLSLIKCVFNNIYRFSNSLFFKNFNSFRKDCIDLCFYNRSLYSKLEDYKILLLNINKGLGGGLSSESCLLFLGECFGDALGFFRFYLSISKS